VAVCRTEAHVDRFILTSVWGFSSLDRAVSECKKNSPLDPCSSSSGGGSSSSSSSSSSSNNSSSSSPCKIKYYPENNG